MAKRQHPYTVHCNVQYIKYLFYIHVLEISVMQRSLTSFLLWSARNQHCSVYSLCHLWILHLYSTFDFWVFCGKLSRLFHSLELACFNFVSKHYETTETFGLSQFSSCFSPFQFFPYIIHCFSVLKHQTWGLVFSLFPELVSILFRNASKQLKHLDLVNFCHVSVHFNFFPI